MKNDASDEDMNGFHFAKSKINVLVFFAIIESSLPY